MNEQQITKLIERYFAAETTLEEEKELRRLLADPSTAHIPLADEARAVIGWARMNATPRRRILPMAFVKIMSAAAMLGIATGVGLSLMLPADRPEGTAVVYIAGQEIHDEQLAMTTALQAFADVAQAKERLDSDISKIFNNINNSTLQ